MKINIQRGRSSGKAIEGKRKLAKKELTKNMKTNRQKIIMNSIKIVSAAVMAIAAATLLKLEFAISAGIISILTIMPTKRETIHTALGRLYAYVAALTIAFVCFEVFGYTVVAFCVYLLFFIVVCRVFRWYSAMAMNSVLISHFVTMGNMGMESLQNEVLLFIIGVGCGIIANMNLRKKADEMQQLQQQTDDQIIRILNRMSERILDRDLSDYNGECFKVLRDLIYEAGAVARENYNNELRSADTFDIDYIDMRSEQCDVLYEMYKTIRKLNTSPVTAGRLSEFLADTAAVFEKDNNVKGLLTELEELKNYMKNQPLPVTRQEFEDRARLFGLMGDIEEFLEIKRDFAERYQ